jgi:hypothetical protein
MPSKRNERLFAAARTALLDLFADGSVPVPELQREFELLAQLIRLQISALDVEVP